MMFEAFIVVYVVAGLAVAYAIYKNPKANMKGLGHNYQYKIVRATILVYAAIAGPAVIATFIAVYMVLLIAGLPSLLIKTRK